MNFFLKLLLSLGITTGIVFLANAAPTPEGKGIIYAACVGFLVPFAITGMLGDS